MSRTGKAVVGERSFVAEPAEASTDAAMPPGAAERDTPPRPRALTIRTLQAMQEQQARRDHRAARYEEARRLKAQGWSLRAIGRAPHLDHKQSYIKSDMPPLLRSHAPKRSKLDPYREYLHRRWEEGCHNVAVLLDELRQREYTGGHSIVRA